MGTEFVDRCKERGFIRELTIPYTPQQNGVAIANQLDLEIHQMDVKSAFLMTKLL